jgi:hypothetical protein
MTFFGHFLEWRTKTLALAVYSLWMALALTVLPAQRATAYTFDDLAAAVAQWNDHVESMRSEVVVFDDHLLAARENLTNHYATLAPEYWQLALSAFGHAEQSAASMEGLTEALQAINLQIQTVAADLDTQSIPYSLTTTCCGVQLGPIPATALTYLFLGLPPPSEGVPEFMLDKLAVGSTGSGRLGLDMLGEGGGVIGFLHGLWGKVKDLLRLAKIGRGLGALSDECSPEEDYKCAVLFEQCVKETFNMPSTDSLFRKAVSEMDADMRRTCGFDRWISDPLYATYDDKKAGYVIDFLRGGDGVFDCADCKRVFGPLPAQIHDNFRDLCVERPYLPECNGSESLRAEDALRRVKELLDKYKCNDLWKPDCWKLVTPLSAQAWP